MRPSLFIWILLLLSCQANGLLCNGKSGFWAEADWENDGITGDFIFIRGCNLSISVNDNITLDDIYVDTSSNLDIRGNLTVKSTLENNGHVIIYERGNLTVSYLRNFASVYCLNRLSVNTNHKNFGRIIMWDNSVLALNMQTNTDDFIFGLVSLTNATINGKDQITIGRSNMLQINGECSIKPGLSIKDTYIIFNGNLTTDSYQHLNGFFDVIPGNGFLQANNVDINASFHITSFNYIGLIQFVKTNNTLKCNFHNIRGGLYLSDEIHRVEVNITDKDAYLKITTNLFLDKIDFWILVVIYSTIYFLTVLFFDFFAPQ